MRPGRSLVPILAGLSAAAVLTACGGSSATSSSNGNNSGPNRASAPGITATEVKIGGHTPLTGPAAPGYSEIDPAAAAYFSYVNANGGVNGRKIVFDYKDDGYNPSNTATVTRQLVTQDKVFAMFSGLGTPTHEAVVDYLNASRVPDLFVSSGCLCWNDPQKHPYTFGWQPDYYVEGKVLGNYIKQNFAGKKIGYLLQGDDFGTDGARGLDAEIPKAWVVDRETYTPTNTDLGPQMAKLKAAGVQVLVDFTIPAFTAISQLTGLAIGFSPQLVVSTVGSDPTTLGGLLSAISKGKANASVLEGMISDLYLPPTDDTSNSWVALFNRIRLKYAPKLPMDGNVEYGMAQAYTFVRALKAAGKNPTRQSILAAIEANKGLAGPGLVPFRYSKTNHSGFTGVQVFQIKGGKISLIGSPQTTDDGSGPIQNYSGTQPAAPANGIGS